MCKEYNKVDLNFFLMLKDKIGISVKFLERLLQRNSNNQLKKKSRHEFFFKIEV